MRPLINEIHELERNGLKLEIKDIGLLLAQIQFHSSLVEWIKATQVKDPKLHKMIKEIKNEKANDFKVNANRVLRCNDCLCVPKVDELRSLILEEAHHSAYTIHPGSIKMYQDLKQLY